MWTGLFWHRTALCKYRDGLYMSQNPCIKRKYSSIIQQCHRQVHSSILSLAHIQWTPTCFGQQCWPKRIGFHWMWTNFSTLLCTCLCYCSIQIVMNFVQTKNAADIMTSWATVSFQTKLCSLSYNLTFRCSVQVCLGSFLRSHINMSSCITRVCLTNPLYPCPEIIYISEMTWDFIKLYQKNEIAYLI